MNIIIRDAEFGDEKGILELCSMIWDGGDYIPWLLEKWLFSEDPFVLAEDTDTGKVVGTDHAMIQRDIAWLEGLRVHPDYRGKGISEMLFGELLKKLVRMRITKMRSMIWSGNRVSEHISEKHRFFRSRTYYMLNLDLSKIENNGNASRSIVVKDLFPADIKQYSKLFGKYFDACQRKFPDGWVEYEDPYFLGNRILIEKNDSGLLCGVSTHEKNVLSINLVKSGDAFDECILKAVEIARGFGCVSVQVNVPIGDLDMLDDFLKIGFEHLDFNEENNKVSVYEYDDSSRDREFFSAQMGVRMRELDNYFGTAVRCSFGFPQVVESYPVKKGRPFPTLFYLCCPYLIYHVSKMEEKGLISVMEKEKMTLYKQAHDFYKRLRMERLKYSYRFYDVYESYPEAYDKGIGGIENSESIKCLHLQLATTLGGVRSEAGANVKKMLENSGIGLECKDCQCIHFL